MIKRIVLMGGSVRRGYNDGSKPQAEYNIVADVKAAQTVFTSGVPLVVAPLDATAMVKLDKARQKKLFDAGSYPDPFRASHDTALAGEGGPDLVRPGRGYVGVYRKILSDGELTRHRR